MALLMLIGNPQSQAAADFLAKLSAEKDAAVAALNQSQLNHSETARLAATISDLEKREIALAEREATLTARETAFKATMQRIANLAPKGE
jgi:hypothetical protein